MLTVSSGKLRLITAILYYHNTYIITRGYQSALVLLFFLIAFDILYRNVYFQERNVAISPPLPLAYRVIEKSAVLICIVNYRVNGVMSHPFDIMIRYSIKHPRLCYHLFMKP